VHESLQNRHALLDDVVARLAGEVGHHSHTARVVLVFAAVESVVFVLALIGRAVDVVYSLHIVCNLAQPMPSGQNPILLPDPLQFL